MIVFYSQVPLWSKTLVFRPHPVLKDGVSYADERLGEDVAPAKRKTQRPGGLCCKIAGRNMQASIKFANEKENCPSGKFVLLMP